ncbi:MAG: PEP-CTERM sorting domain-containing protein [Cellvibrionaceae bacterium]
MYRYDWDGRYTYGYDQEGNFWNDSDLGSSVCLSVQYDTVPAANVSEPGTLFLLGAGLLGLAGRRITMEV